MLTITDNAKKQFVELLTLHNKKYIKLSVNNKGCNGHSYSLDFIDELSVNLEKFPLEEEKLLVVDFNSLLYVSGIEIDYVENKFESLFKFINPNAKSYCGCGTSFSV